MCLLYTKLINDPGKYLYYINYLMDQYCSIQNIHTWLAKHTNTIELSWWLFQSRGQSEKGRSWFWTPSTRLPNFRRSFRDQLEVQNTSHRHRLGKNSSSRLIRINPDRMGWDKFSSFWWPSRLRSLTLLAMEYYRKGSHIFEIPVYWGQFLGA